MPRGHSSGAFSLDVPSGGVGYSVQCLLPAGHADRAHVMLTFSEDDEPSFDVSCDDDLSPGVFTPAQQKVGLVRIGVAPTVNDRTVSIPGVQIAVGVYAG